MNVSIFGLGYVGTVTAACLAEAGHRVIGVDVAARKLELIRAGCSPVAEEGLDTLVADGVASGSLSVTDDPAVAIAETDLSMVSVGTPSLDDGSVDLSQIRRVSEEIARGLRHKSAPHLLAYRSTVLPGTTEDVVIPILEAQSGKRAHTDFDVCFTPEFLREGVGVSDFRSPPLTVVGQSSEGPARTLAALYGMPESAIDATGIRAAEFLKYACNSYHALKVCFANEIGALARHQGVDGAALMELFARDTQLNISPAYLKPGFAFGGSCLPKDVRALVRLADELECTAPVLASITPSNAAQLERGVDVIRSLGIQTVGLLGLAFKPGTDDVRESPLVIFAERLIAEGYTVRIYDRYLNFASVLGENKAFLDDHLPNAAALMTSSADALIRDSEVLVIGNADPEYSRAARHVDSRPVVDFTGVLPPPETTTRRHRIGC